MAKQVILRLHESEMIELTLYRSTNDRVHGKPTTMAATLRQGILASAHRKRLDLSRFGLDHHERFPLTVSGEVETALETLQTRFPDASLTAIILGCMRATETLIGRKPSQKV